MEGLERRRPDARRTRRREAGQSAAAAEGPTNGTEGASAPSGTDAGDWELFLLRLRYREGRRVTLAGNTPILLDDPEMVWVVFTGLAEVFVVRVAGGQPAGPRRHLFSGGPGTALFGADLTGRPIGLLVSGTLGTQLLRVRRQNLARLAESPGLRPQVSGLIDTWVNGLMNGLDHELPPREFRTIEPGVELTLRRAEMVRARRGVLWTTHLEGSSHFLSRAELPVGDGETAVPLTPAGWLETTGPSRLVGVETLPAFERVDLWRSVDAFDDLVLGGLGIDVERREVCEHDRLSERTDAQQARLESAYVGLASILGSRDGRVGEIDRRNPLLAAARLVGAAQGIEIKPAPSTDNGRQFEEPLSAIARASRARFRKVALRGEWWAQIGAPMVGYLEGDHRPVALLAREDGGFDLHDPVDGIRTPVTRALSATIEAFGYTFYRPFEHRALGARDLIRFGLRGCGADLRAVALAVITAGLLGLLTPLVTGVLFDMAIPGGQVGLLGQMTAGLVVAAISTLMFQITREVATLRLAGRMDGAIQAAVMDRLLDLPATFFREYTAGDLALRALGISQIRETLSRVVLTTLISAVSSVFNIVLLFWYDVKLALVGCGLILIALIAIGTTGVIQVHYQQALGEMSGRLAGLVFQLITGVPKLRVAGAEGHAFAYWAADFARQRQVTYKAGLARNALACFNGAFPVLASMALFAVFALVLDPQPSLGSFLGFNAAFGQLVAASLLIGMAFIAAVAIVPAFERVLPILQTLPEVDASKADPGELSGAIDVDHVSFRYAENGPPVLDDISIRIRPGELVALVGPSGSGKSTLLRLLLGFERPSSGTILYDGRDLGSLDVRSVRRQIGTVLQNGRLLSGDIFRNIVGSSTLTLEDAWTAARMAGFDDDIRQMPMQMHTVISEGGGTLSGGQRQRLLIARALVSRPRIIYFDEATSALDNRTQEVVARALDGLAATRVVIAHRLSTVVNADRIYVLRDGRLVESGTYRELMQRRGLFAELARRQLA